MVGDRLINDHNFECPSLIGMTVESLIGFYEGKVENGIDMLILKLKELELYQRFFLDAAIGFWEENDFESVNSDYEDAKKIDLAEKYSLFGTKVVSIVCHGSVEEFSSLVFDIGTVKLHFHYLDRKNMDSETVLEKLETSTNFVQVKV